MGLDVERTDRQARVQEGPGQSERRVHRQDGGHQPRRDADRLSSDPGDRVRHPAGSTGYPASGLLGGVVTRSGSASVRVGPANTSCRRRRIRSSSSSAAAVRRPTTWSTRAQRSPTRRSRPAARSTASGQRQPLNTEIKTGFDYPSFAAGWRGPAPPARSRGSTSSGDLVNSDDLGDLSGRSTRPPASTSTASAATGTAGLDHRQITVQRARDLRDFERQAAHPGRPATPADARHWRTTGRLPPPVAESGELPPRAVVQRPRERASQAMLAPASGPSLAGGGSLASRSGSSAALTTARGPCPSSARRRSRRSGGGRRGGSGRRWSSSSRAIGIEPAEVLP